MTPSCRPSLAADIPRIAPRLRSADVQEIRASAGITPADALWMGLRRSQACYTITPDGFPEGMFGVTASGDPMVGVVWMLCTDEVPTRFKRQFVRESRQWFDLIHEHYPVLWNYVDCRNTVHIRWLQWLGCSFGQVRPEYGIAKKPFIEFHHVSPPCSDTRRNGNRLLSRFGSSRRNSVCGPVPSGSCSGSLPE